MPTGCCESGLRSSKTTGFQQSTPITPTPVALRLLSLPTFLFLYVSSLFIDHERDLAGADLGYIHWILGSTQKFLATCRLIPFPILLFGTLTVRALHHTIRIGRSCCVCRVTNVVVSGCSHYRRCAIVSLSESPIFVMYGWRMD